MKGAMMHYCDCDICMADAYRTCYVNLWPLPQEVVNWYERKQREATVAGEGDVRESLGLKGLNSPWYYHTLNENGKEGYGWLFSAESETIATPTRVPEDGTTIRINHPGGAAIADLEPGEQLKVSNGIDRTMCVRVSFENWGSCK